MEVILLERVENLGQLGDQVKVKPGYARNYLIPQGKATEATKENVARFETRRAELERAAAEALSTARARAERMTDLVVTVIANAGNEGRLFGSVGPAEIVDAVTATGNELAKREVRLPEGPIRQTGEYDVPLHLHSDIEVTVRVNVVPA